MPVNNKHIHQVGGSCLSINGGDASSGSICDGETRGEGMGVSSWTVTSVLVTSEKHKKTANQKKGQQTSHKKRKQNKKSLTNKLIIGVWN